LQLDLYIFAETVSFVMRCTHTSVESLSESSMFVVRLLSHD